MCTQQLEQVTVNVTLRAIDLSINSTIHPPVPDEMTQKRLTGPATNDSELQRFDGHDRDSVNRHHMSTTVGMDGFVKTLDDGKAGTPIASLLGSANQVALIEAGSRLYAEYMAQAIPYNMRNATSLTNTVGGAASNTADGELLGGTSTFQGTLTRAPGSRWRLRQNRGPSIALEALLFLLAADALLGVLFVGWEGAEVLPHNPCSITGTAICA